MCRTKGSRRELSGDESLEQLQQELAPAGHRRTDPLPRRTFFNKFLGDSLTQGKPASECSRTANDPSWDSAE